MEVVDGVSIVRFSHAPDVEEVYAQMEKFSAFNAPLRMWVFLRGLELTVEELKKIVVVGGQKDFSLGNRVAYVSPVDLGFGIARMFEVYVDELPLETRVFRNEEDAMAWLLG